ncbi:hypothetical protein VTN49DRAFT_5616 [Thermomyces lanuginosus]|uniref:uncharacterized protein n=1 Tax=Thermomyces lanuginosus TaxID=5541 RepID=UPI003744720C
MYLARRMLFSHLIVLNPSDLSYTCHFKTNDKCPNLKNTCFFQNPKRNQNSFLSKGSSQKTTANILRHHD